MNVRPRRDGMLVVTTDQIPGYEVRAVIGEVLGIAAKSVSPFVEGLRSLRDGKGVPPEVRVSVLTQCRREAVERMIDEAAHRGANAVVAMRFDHRQVTESWNEICAYGTAVWAIPVGVAAPAARTSRPPLHAGRPAALPAAPGTPAPTHTSVRDERTPA